MKKYAPPPSKADVAALRLRVELHLRRKRMRPSAFGRAVLRDPCFVFDLREGRLLRAGTFRRVDEYLAREEADAAAEGGRQ